jgi:hemolysin activation/secretion protein
MRMAKNFIRLSAFVLAVLLAVAIIDFALAAEKPVQQLKEKRQVEPIAKKESPKAKKQKQLSKEELDRIKLSEDTSPRLKVKEMSFSGNTLVPTSELLADLPVIFNASDKPLTKAESQNLYDFRPLQEIISSPGQFREVSTRTIQGLTQYVLSVYQQKNYGGVYVYIPAESLKAGAELKEGVLQVDIIETMVSSVGTKFYDVNQTLGAKGYLDANTLKAWSPVKPGVIVNQKQLDDFLNLLNLNPDRYITATVSKGSEPNTLSVDYGIYEVNPWHYFIQIDNSGVRESRWNPKIGVINTNLLGFDDQFMAVYQFRPDSSWNDNYSLYGSYDFPITGPGLRLNIYGGYSEFDVSSSSSDISFIGGGKFIGANLRYNVFQADDWFFDVIGSFSEEESKNTPSIFPEFLASKVRTTLVGGGIDIHRRDDMSLASLGYKYTANVGGSGRNEFVTARTDAEKYFSIHNFYGSYSRVLDPNKVTKVSTSLRWIVTDDRLVPSKMTPFGGMYSVRGYKEYEVIADEGILASAQYEFDIIRNEKLKASVREEVDKEESKAKGLKKFAPLVFTDYGWSRINDASSAIGEKTHETLWSAGIGALAEYGNNLSAAVYYGIALRDTEDTDAGDGRVNVSFMLRW